MHNIEVKIVGSLQEGEVLWVDLEALGYLSGDVLEEMADHVLFIGEGRSVLQGGYLIESAGSIITIRSGRGLFIQWPARVR